jgi:hypothetical protein
MFYPTPTDVRTFEPSIDKPAVLIGVISDTHIPTRADSLPAQVIKAFQRADLIVHAGDWVSLAVANELSHLAPLIGVRGNMDWPEIRQAYPELAIIRLFDWRIGVWHGTWLPFVAERVADEHGLNVLITGHRHRPTVRKDSVIFVNPGSPTNPLLARPSVALLYVTKDGIDVELIYL